MVLFYILMGAGVFLGFIYMAIWSLALGEMKDNSFEKRMYLSPVWFLKQERFSDRGKRYCKMACALQVAMFVVFIALFFVVQQ